jgi:hypothetical protein
MTLAPDPKDTTPRPGSLRDQIEKVRVRSGDLKALDGKRKIDTLEGWAEAVFGPRDEANDVDLDR